LSAGSDSSISSTGSGSNGSKTIRKRVNPPYSSVDS
jgi:hypothetical protein